MAAQVLSRLTHSAQGLCCCQQLVLVVECKPQLQQQQQELLPTWAVTGVWSVVLPILLLLVWMVAVQRIHALTPGMQVSCQGGCWLLVLQLKPCGQRAGECV